MAGQCRSSYLSALQLLPSVASLCSPANYCTIALINKTNKQMVYFRKVNINKVTKFIEKPKEAKKEISFKGFAEGRSKNV